MEDDTPKELARQYIAVHRLIKKHQETAEMAKRYLIAYAATGRLQRDPARENSWRVDTEDGSVTVTPSEGRETLDKDTTMRLLRDMAATSLQAKNMFDANIDRCYRRGKPFTTVRVMLPERDEVESDDNFDIRAEFERNAAMYDE